MTACAESPEALVLKRFDDFGKSVSERLDTMEKSIAQAARTPALPGGAARLFGLRPVATTAEDRWGWKSSGEFLTAVKSAAISRESMDKRLGYDHVAKFAPDYARKAATGMGESVGSDGGFVLAPDFVNEILKIMHEEGAIWQKARNYSISGPSIKIPAIDESSRATGSRRGGVQGYWKDEGASATASKPLFRQIDLAPHKLMVLTYLTAEMLEDGGTIVEQMVPELAAEEINWLMDEAMLNGTGAGQPVGVVGNAATVSVAKRTGQGAATIIHENIVDMFSRLHVSARKNAVWLINQDCEPQLATMTLNVGTGGLPTYLPPGGLSDKPYATLMGRPVYAIEQCQTVGTVGDIILIDPKQYVTVSRDPIKQQMSIHVAFLTDEQAYRFTYRADGKPSWRTTLTPAHGTNTQSFCVTLATRS